ncbi:MAG: methyltransferase domain-containing protein [Lachnospiraceae bacterium]|nr:methyltransferase domain-containing protein [Lachnospiraceae bacterium]
MDNKIVLYGGGKTADYIYSKYKDSIIGVIDNYKSGMFRRNVPYLSLEDFQKRYFNTCVYISSIKYADQMRKELEEAGIKYKLPDELFEDPNVHKDEEICHENWMEYIRHLADFEGARILEVGSRVQTGTNLRGLFKKATYIGFDYYNGENVDVVGDAHKLTSYFDDKFDLIFSSAVFEHLAMPWIVSTEIIKLLKMGGHVFVETHYSYSSHERPWHFFQFSENALNVLFPECFGIECIKKGCSNLIRNGEFSETASDELKGKMVSGLYCHSELLGKKVKELDEEEYDWRRCSLDDVVGATRYPYH